MPQWIPTSSLAVVRNGCSIGRPLVTMRSVFGPVIVVERFELRLWIGASAPLVGLIKHWARLAIPTDSISMPRRLTIQTYNARDDQTPYLDRADENLLV